MLLFPSFSLPDWDIFTVDVQFGNGCLVGIVGTLALLILLKLLVVLYRTRYPRRAKGIMINGDLGSIFITPRAISDLVVSLQDEFDSITVKKVTLLENKHHYSVRVNVLYYPEESSIPEVKAKNESLILDVLKDRFGVDCIRKVALVMDKAPVGPKQNSRF